jgi:hypothetical protein
VPRLLVGAVIAAIDMALICPGLIFIGSWHLWPPLPLIVGGCYSTLIAWTSLQIANQIGGMRER